MIFVSALSVCTIDRAPHSGPFFEDLAKILDFVPLVPVPVVAASSVHIVASGSAKITGSESKWY